MTARIVCILGENGSGRSTLLRSLAAQGYPTFDDFGDGVHHSRIGPLMEALRELPVECVYITTQNPHVVDHLRFERESDFTETFIFCHRTNGAFTTRTPTERDAHEFWQAYEVGIQHVSEILRSEGLEHDGGREYLILG